MSLFTTETGGFGLLPAGMKCLQLNIALSLMPLRVVEGNMANDVLVIAGAAEEGHPASGWPSNHYGHADAEPGLSTSFG